jgi:hypothetical protein
MASNFAIGDCVRYLKIQDQGPNRPIFNDETSRQDHLGSFISYIPYVKTLALVSLGWESMKLVPSFPTVEHIWFMNVTVRAKQLFRILSSSSSMESMSEYGLWISPDGDTNGRTGISAELSGSGGRSRLDWTNLKSYHTVLRDQDSPETFLFSNNPEFILPSLTHLSLWLPPSNSVRMAVRLMQTAYNSLRYLLIKFNDTSDSKFS